MLEHVWFRDYSIKLRQFIRSDYTHIDEVVCKKLERLGINQNKAKSDFVNHSFSPDAANYRMFRREEIIRELNMQDVMIHQKKPSRNSPKIKSLHCILPELKRTKRKFSIPVETGSRPKTIPQVPGA